MSHTHPHDHAPAADTLSTCQLGCSRRKFIGMSLAAVVFSQLASGLTAAVIKDAKTVDLGPAKNFPDDKIYDQFYSKGFYLIRKDGKFIALSSVCTHEGHSGLTLKPDNTFVCKGTDKATFDASGTATYFAKTALPIYPVTQNADGNLIVSLPAKFRVPPDATAIF